METSAAIVLDRVSKRYGAGAHAVDARAGREPRGAGGRVRLGHGAERLGEEHAAQPDRRPRHADAAAACIVAGEELARLSDDERSRLRLRHVGFVFQAFNLFPTFTVEENVAWPLEFLGAPLERRAAAGRRRCWRASASTRRRARRRPAELSGGEQQRVAIARALATEPDLLLADEPTGNLDSHTGQSILDLLRALNVEHRLTIVLVTHSTFAATYGHRTVELRDGRIVARGARGARAGRRARDPATRVAAATSSQLTPGPNASARPRSPGRRRRARDLLAG